MAIKPFEIQGSTLTIGGVDLQAGNTSIVIPGVTQATSYKVEEVDDREDQTLTFQSPPVIIDYVTYNDYVQSGTSTGRAEYIVEELDDDGYIDDIEVTDEGSNYNEGDAGENEASDMLAYTGSAGDPFASFVQGDWTAIPFRPKMRAGEIETIGGGGDGVATVVDDTPPGDPVEGALWYDTGTGRTYIYYDSNWIDAAPSQTIPEMVTTSASVVSNALTLDFNYAWTTVEMTAGNSVTSITFVNPPTSGIVKSITVEFIQPVGGGQTVTSSNYITAGGAGLDISTGSGARSIVTFVTRDGGVTYYGFSSGKDWA